MPDLTTSQESTPAGRPTWLKRLLYEPLIHFLILAAALFAVYRVMHPPTGDAEPSNRIVLTVDDLSQMSITWLAQGRSAPTPEQMQHLVAAKVREEILYREALALGLDKDDTIIKRRLAQKMEFLAEDLSSLTEPSSQDLKDWFAANQRRFAVPPRASFRHLYFSFDRRGSHTQKDAVSALASFAEETRDSPRTATLSDPFMFQDTYGDRTFTQIATTFGPNFARALFTLKPGSWSGPVESGYGWHLIWIDSMTAERVPLFEEVEESAKSEWMADQREQTKRKMFEGMRARYQVVLPEAPAKREVGTSSPAPTAGAVTAGN